MPAPEHFDAIVVGAGQAGPALAARCVKEGLRVALVERDRLGGTCVNTGCFPTKTLYASARAMHLARRGAEFGFACGDVQVDMRRVKARKDEIVDAARTGLESWVRGLQGLEWITGHARFAAPGQLRVGERLLAAPKIFLDVGTRPAHPPLPGIADVATLDNVSALELEEVPRHLVIVGGSYIGLEFAQVLRRFGAEVTVVERSPRFLPREDEDIAAEIRAILEAEGVRFRLGAECMAFERAGAGVRLLLECQAGEPAVEGSHVLLAMGRTPNTDDLGLDAAGIATDTRGHVVVDDQCRASVEGVWALGDCNGRGGFTHTAWNDHEIVVDHLFGSRTRGLGQRIPCYALFIDPPLGRVGKTEQEVRADGTRALLATLPMRRVGRAKESGETQGLMKVLVDADSRQILGASLLGLNGDEVVHSLLNAMTAGVPCTALEKAVPIHPTVSELLPTLLHGLAPLASPAPA
ncbi:FAD-containing oxidoreductase [Ramlibacter sp. USB13]|uniref:FAD-containing oxidoreductase n=1 Tax=Ramlibacter cellulosilyticus TaxID=2764187 RepID=A0A923MKS0_9BURK|nr:FAD-containing oxidoreductase [Ramlibacter cellulosilyticus]MBC5781427.1 FAD-containing oxidoreductase [Ramlibacter cellulosilyticus]